MKQAAWGLSKSLPRPIIRVNTETELTIIRNIPEVDLVIVYIFQMNCTTCNTLISQLELLGTDALNKEKIEVKIKNYT